MTIWEHQIIMLEIQRARILDSGNKQINLLNHRSIVTLLRSHRFQALPSSTTLPHSTWHQACNQALVVRSQDIRVMGHRGKDTTSPKEDMVDLNWSPLSNSQDRGHHLWHQLETFQSIGQHLPALLHTDKFLAHLGDLPVTSQWNDFSRQQNRARKMLQGLRIGLHDQIFLMTNSMQMLRAIICRTWAGPKAKPQSAWSQWNSPWSNLPKGWRSPTLVYSTSGRKYGWLGFSRRSISPFSWDRTIWNSSRMDPCTGRWRLQFFRRLSTPGCGWKILTMPNGFGDSGWRCFWRNVQVRLGIQGRREGEVTSDRRRIWESVWAIEWEEMSQSAKFNVYGCNSSSAERQQWPDIK